jgi:hypothetical protein
MFSHARSAQAADGAAEGSGKAADMPMSDAEAKANPPAIHRK